MTSSRGPSSRTGGGSVLDLDDPLSLETLERRAHVADLGIDIEGHLEVMENDHYIIEIDHGREGSEGSQCITATLLPALAILSTGAVSTNLFE